MEAITFRNHIKQAWPIALILIGFVLLPSIGFYKAIGIGEVFSVKQGLIISSIIFLPQFLLHVIYYYLNQGISLEIFSRKKSFKYCLEENCREIYYDDISKIKVVLNRAVYRNSLQWFPWQSYSYVVITTYEGEDIVLTSLLVDDIGWLYDSDKTEVKATTYCWPPL